MKKISKKPVLPPSIAKCFKPVYLDWLVFGVYAALCFVIVLRHEPWSDEAQPWLLARDSNLGFLLKALLNNYDRHPGLWYLILYGLSHSGLPYLSMGLANLVFILAGSLLFLLKSPFPRWLKYPFLFSYYMIYEYAAIARTYGLTILLLFAAAFLYEKRFRRPLLYGFTLMLLFNADYIMMGFPAALTMLYAIDLWKKRDWNSWQSAGLVLMLLGGTLVLIQGGILPPDHVDYAKKAAYIKEWFFLSKSYFPFLINVPETFSYAASSAIIYFSFWSLRKRLSSLFVLFLSYGLLFYIFKFRHWGDLRHYGFVIISLLAVYWIDFTTKNTSSEASKEKPKWKPLQQMVMLAVALCLLVSARFSYYAWNLDYHAIFSGGKNMAGMIDMMFKNFDLKKEDYVITAHKHTTTVGILPYLPGYKFWIPSLGREATYYLNTKDMDKDETMSSEEALKKIEASFPDMSKVFLIFDKKLEMPQTEKYYYNILVDMSSYYIFGYRYEKFYLYRAIPRKAS